MAASSRSRRALEQFRRRKAREKGRRQPWLALALLELMFCAVSGLNFEGQALWSFKEAIVEDPEGVLGNWDARDEDPCRWTGVFCAEESFGGRGGNVITLSIPKAKLVGSISSQLGLLLHIRHLNLHGNHLSGPLPPHLFNASTLQSLVLFENRFSGALPPEIGHLAQLQILDLSNNSFAGSIPSTISKCRRLRRLDLSNNNFSGSIPVAFGSSLTSLLQLDLSSNSLFGSIPPSLGYLPSLQGTLNLSHNYLSGPIPATLGYLPVPVNLDFTNNNLSGTIPRNGTLADQGPGAFLGNPGLCGVPLQNPCSASPALPPLPFLPHSDAPNLGVPLSTVPVAHKSKSLSRGAIAAIALGNAAGIALISLVCMYCCCRKARQRSKGGSPSSGGREDYSGGWLCVGGTREAGQRELDQLEQGELVALDNEVAFNLEELLKASAYILGKSGLGIVYKVILPDGLTVAVRRLGEGGSNRFKEFEDEVETIGRVRHPNIVSLRAYYWAVDEKLLIYDYIPNGSLASALHGHALASSEPLLWSSRLKIAQGAARGLAYLHECSTRKFVHGDIKPCNILLDLNMEPYISDFGLNRLLNIAGSGVPVQPGISGGRNSSGLQDSLSGTDINIWSSYQAPEATKSSKPTQKWDVYSLGLILLELLTGKTPVIKIASSQMHLVQWVETALEEMKPLPQILDPILVDELHKVDEMLTVLKVALVCVSFMPEQRFSMKHVAELLNKINSPF